MAITPTDVINGVQAVRSLFDSKKKQDERQVQQNRRLNADNANTAKELAGHEHDLKMKMWKDTNYNAQLEQAELAGVSKAHVLGSGGVGTGSGASVGSVSGSNAADAAATQAADTNKRLADAQIGNIIADTELKKTQSGKTGQETTNLGLDQKWKEIDNRIKGATEQDAINIITDTAREQFASASIKQGEHGIMENTQMAQINEIRANAVGAALRNDAIRKGLQIGDAQINKMGQDIAQGWAKLKLDKRNLDQNDERIKIERFNKQMGADYPGMWNVVGKAMIDMFKGMGANQYDTKMK